MQVMDVSCDLSKQWRLAFETRSLDNDAMRLIWDFCKRFGLHAEICNQHDPIFLPRKPKTINEDAVIVILTHDLEGDRMPPFAEPSGEAGYNKEPPF